MSAISTKPASFMPNTFGQSSVHMPQRVHSLKSTKGFFITTTLPVHQNTAGRDNIIIIPADSMSFLLKAHPFKDFAHQAFPAFLHLDRSRSVPHAVHLCFLFISSPKISFAFPHEGQSQLNVLNDLLSSFPGHLVSMFHPP